MNRFILVISIFAVSLLSNTASAQGYWGVKALSVGIDASGYSNAFNGGLFAGAEFARLGSAKLAFEGEITKTILDGETDLKRDWTIDTLALYAALRTEGDIYLKLKAGALNRDITTSIVNTPVSGSHSSLSWGVGFGFSNFEIEYTFIEGAGETDLNMISLGFMF